MTTFREPKEQELQDAFNFVDEQSGFDTPETTEEETQYTENGLQVAFSFTEPKPEDTSSDVKQYLLLYNIEEDGQEIRSYEFITGRRKIYDFLIPMIEDGTLDCVESTVIVQGSPIEYGVSVYVFMKEMEKRFPDELFNIDNYVDIESVGIVQEV